MIRPATPSDAPAIARVHVDSWRETYAGIVPSDFLDGLSYERREQMWRGGLENPNWSGQMLVAEVQNKVVGFVAGGKPQKLENQFDCELWAIYLLKVAQGQGLGRDLFDSFAKSMHTQGHRSMVLWVLRDNPTANFYRHLGGIKVAETELEIGGKKLLEDAYGWDNLEVTR